MLRRRAVLRRGRRAARGHFLTVCAVPSSCEASHILVKGSGSKERCMELKEEVLDRVSIPMGACTPVSLCAHLRVLLNATSAKEY